MVEISFNADNWTMVTCRGNRFPSDFVRLIFQYAEVSAKKIYALIA